MPYYVYTTGIRFITLYLIIELVLSVLSLHCVCVLLRPRIDIFKNRIDLSSLAISPHLRSPRCRHAMARGLHHHGLRVVLCHPTTGQRLLLRRIGRPVQLARESLRLLPDGRLRRLLLWPRPLVVLVSRLTTWLPVSAGFFFLFYRLPW